MNRAVTLEVKIECYDQDAPLEYIGWTLAALGRRLKEFPLADNGLDVAARQDFAADLNGDFLRVACSLRADYSGVDWRYDLDSWSASLRISGIHHPPIEVLYNGAFSWPFAVVSYHPEVSPWGEAHASFLCEADARSFAVGLAMRLAMVGSL